MNMTKEEKMISNLRRRKRLNIILITLAIVFLVVSFVYMMHLRKLHDDRFSADAIEEVLTVDQVAAPQHIVLSKMLHLTRADARLGDVLQFFAVMIGVMIGGLVVTVFDLTDRRLLIALWDRLQELEKQLGERGGGP